MRRLYPLELTVLKYIRENPGHKRRDIAWEMKRYGFTNCSDAGNAATMLWRFGFVALTKNDELYATDQNEIGWPPDYEEFMQSANKFLSEYRDLCKKYNMKLFITSGDTLYVDYCDDCATNGIILEN